MTRRLITRFARIALMVICINTIGCAPAPPGRAVNRLVTNDYQVDYDGEEKRTTVGPGLIRIFRHPEDIEVSDGKLRVGARNYGTIAKNDRIAVVGGKVIVNLLERQPSIP